MRGGRIVALLFGILLAVAVGASARFWGGRWLFHQLVLLSFVALWQGTAPRLKARPVRITYRWGMGILGLGLLMLLVDQPTDIGTEHRVPPSFNVLLASDDKMLEDVQFFTSPSIVLSHIEGNTWYNYATASAGIPEDAKGERLIIVAFLLPEGADLPEKPSASDDSVCDWDDDPTGAWASCTLRLGPKNRSDTFHLEFEWKPVSHRMGMGQQRVLLARRHAELWAPVLSPSARSRLHPLLVVEGNIATTDLDQAHPTPFRSHRDRVVWRLDEPVDIGDEVLEVTLEDRRVRDVFDLTPEILALAGGLLLGLVSQQLIGAGASDQLHRQQADLNQALGELNTELHNIQNTLRAREKRWGSLQRRRNVLVVVMFLVAYAERRRIRRRRH